MDYEPIFSMPETPETIESEIDTIYEQFCLAATNHPTQFSIIKGLSISHLASILDSILEIQTLKPNTYVFKYKGLEKKIKQTILEIQSAIPGLFLTINNY